MEGKTRRGRVRNVTIRLALKVKLVSDTIKTSQMRYFGHVWRMCDERLPRKEYEARIYWQRCRGRVRRHGKTLCKTSWWTGASLESGKGAYSSEATVAIFFQLLDTTRENRTRLRLILNPLLLEEKRVQNKPFCFIFRNCNILLLQATWQCQLAFNWTEGSNGINENIISLTVVTCLSLIHI